MINAQVVTAVVVTKGGYDISPVIDSLKRIGEVIVWDNSKAVTDRKVFGRYLAAMSAKNDIIYVQDDDCIVPTEAVFSYWPDPEGRMLCNVPVSRRKDYVKRMPITLVGWGSLFHRVDLEVFKKYLDKYPEDELFDRECDRVFSYLVPHVEIEVPFQHLDYAFGSDRMGLEQRHGDDLQEIRRRLLAL